MTKHPLFPHNQPLHVWLIVIFCFVFWLIAYTLIIRWGFKEKTFGMPVTALIGNIVWEALFSHYFVPYYGLIRWGNTAWVAFDIGIFLTVWKYGPDDFSIPFVKRHLRKMIPLGIVLAAMIMIPFTKFYHDQFGTCLGWSAAFMMSILFIAMLLRRNSYKGQTIYIALSMFLGNIAAYFWVAYFPEHQPPQQMGNDANLAFMLATGVFNVAYIVMLYQKCREMGVNPWKRIW